MKMKTFPVGMLNTNCYIAWAPETGAAFIVDPAAAADRILSFTAEHGLKPEAILLTHGHFDHVLGIDGWKHAYPGIEVYAAAAERDLLADPELNMTNRFRRKAEEIVPEHFLLDGQIFEAAGMKLTFLHTPGHTAGSGCYYYEGDEECGHPVLFSGDTLFRGSCGRTDFETGSMEQMLESLARLSELPADTAVYPGHGPGTDIAWELECNPYMRGETE